MFYFNGLIIFCLALFISCASDDPEIEIPSNNDSFNLLWEHSTAPFLPQGVTVDKRGSDTYLFVAAKAGGLLVFDVSLSVIEEIARIPIDELSGHHAMHIYQQGNFVYLSLGDFFVKEARAGMAVINVSVPHSPVVTDIWEASETGEGSAIVIVEENFAYIGAMSDGVYVLDISDKSNVIETDHYIPDVNFPVANPNSIQEPNARGMTIRDDELFVAFDAGGIRVLDVSDKTNVHEIGRYINDTFEKPKAYNNILLNGKYAYTAVDYCGLEILDISDLSNITRTSWCNPWACDTDANTWFNSEGHANQLFLNAINNTVVLSTGKSEITIMDVSQPDNCKLVTSYGALDNNLGVWGLALDDNKVYALYINTLIPFIGTWSGIKYIELPQ